MTCLYISGPMSGLPDANYPAFNAAAEALRAAGYEVENPAENPKCEDWHGYMRLSLAQVAKVDALVMLPGWENSRGAAWEHHIASALLELPAWTLEHALHLARRPDVVAEIDRLEAEETARWREQRVQEAAKESKPPRRWRWPFRSNA